MFAGRFNYSYGTGAILSRVCEKRGSGILPFDFMCDSRHKRQDAASTPLAAAGSCLYDSAMNAVLHVVDARTSRDMLEQLALLCRPGDRVVSLGPPPPRAALERAEIVRPMPFAAAVTAWRRPEMTRGVSAVHVWSLSTAAFACDLAKHAGCHCIISLPHLPDTRSLERLAQYCACGQATLTFPTASAAKRAEATANIPASSLAVLPPACAAQPVTDAARIAARRALNIPDGDIVLANPQEMLPGAGHKYAMWVHGILLHMEISATLLLPGGGPHEPRLRYFLKTAGFPAKVRMTGYEVPAADCVAAADIALLLDEKECGVGSLASIMAAGVPVVASSTPDNTELTQNGDLVLLARPKVPQEASAAVLKLLDDPAGAKAMAERARTLAQEAFSVRACREALGAIYARAGVATS